MSDNKIFITLMGLTAIAFMSTITSVKASTLDSFKVQKGDATRIYNEAEIISALSGNKTCVFAGSSLMYKSKNLTKKQCSKGKQFLNVIKWKEIDPAVQRKLLGL